MLTNTLAKKADKFSLRAHRSGFQTKEVACLRSTADPATRNRPPATCPPRWTHHLSHFFITATTCFLIMKCGLFTGLQLLLGPRLYFKHSTHQLSSFNAVASLLIKNYRPMHHLKKTHQQTWQPKHVHLLKGFRSKRPTITCFSQHTLRPSTA